MVPDSISVAHAYPGTELYDYVLDRGFLLSMARWSIKVAINSPMSRYPGLPADEMLSALHRFYDEYYFRPKAIFRILKEAAFDRRERRRIYKEAKSFLEVRSTRKQLVAPPIRRHCSE